MRVLARYGRHAVGVRQRIVEAYATGHSKVIQTELTAHFMPGALRPEERELALRSWSFNGFYQEQDEVTQVAPDYRIGVFDSIQAQREHGWSDEERRAVEDELVRLSIEDPNTLIVMAEEKLVAPWPNYDVFTGSLNDLCGKILEDGYPLEDVLAYESENLDRPEVIAALRQLIEDAEAGPVSTVEEIVG